MWFSRALAILLLGTLLAATAAFGADGAVASLWCSAALMAFGGIAMIRLPLPPLGPMWWVGGVGLGIVFAAQLATPVPGDSVPDLLALLAAVAVFLAAASLARDGKGRRRLATYYQVALVLVAGAAFVDFVLSPDLLYGQPRAYHDGRLSAAFLSANTAGLLFGMAAILGLAGTIRTMSAGGGWPEQLDRFARKGLVPLLLLLSAGLCLVLTGSRGAMLATGIASVALVAGYWPRLSTNVRRATAGILVLAAIAGTAQILGAGVDERLATVGTDDTGRGALWRASFAAFLDRPVFGHGFGRFDAAIAAQVTAADAALLSQQGAAHNLLLQWLVQTGIVGTIGGGLVLFAALRPIVSGIVTRPKRRLLLIGYAAAFGVVLLHGLVDYALEIPAILWWVAMLLGLAVGTGLGEGRVERRRRPR